MVDCCLFQRAKGCCYQWLLGIGSIERVELMSLVAFAVDDSWCQMGEGGSRHYASMISEEGF